jgi:Type I phosphodiesterase / nucleotide pyrophosphatase
MTRHRSRQERRTRPHTSVRASLWATLDDLSLRAQHRLDRLIRRLRLGTPPVPGRRRLLIVQIDGLSRRILETALERGLMPFLRRFLARGDHRLAPMSVGIPTSTPAFHMTVMYGKQPDIPGFHYHDKRRGTDIHFIRAGHAAFVEKDQAGPAPGILRGGSVYGCVFTGGAENDFFSFARLTRPRAPGLVRVLSAFVVVGWVAIKCAALTGQEAVLALGRMARRPHRRGAEWRWLKKKVAISVWTREWFTSAVARDVYDGVPAVYVNYLDYDETAHAFGPGSRQAFATLRGVDSSLRQIWRVARRVPEHRYDLYVLADHGQASCAPYHTVSGGQRFERAFFHQASGELRAGVRGRAAPDPSERAPNESAVEAPGPGAGPTELGFEPYLDERESWQHDGVRVVSAGPNAFVYFLDTPQPVLLEEIEARRPGLAAALSKSPGVGFVLTRSAAGPVCFWRGQAHPFDVDGGPFTARDDRKIVTQGLAALMAMPSAGDLVVYGIGAPEGHVSYIDEVGGHAGPSPEELHTFLVAPVEAGLPARIDHPRQLYDVFIRYTGEVERPTAQPRP